MEHDLKCWPEHYAAIECGLKTCELRLNDRPYAAGDALLLREYEPMTPGYTGRQQRVRVTHVLSGGAWLALGYVAMSIRLMGEDNEARVQMDWKGVADAQRKELEDLKQERRALCDVLSADSATVAGQTLAEALMAVIAERDAVRSTLTGAAGEGETT